MHLSSDSSHFLQNKDHAQVLIIRWINLFSVITAGQDPISTSFIQKWTKAVDATSEQCEPNLGISSKCHKRTKCIVDGSGMHSIPVSYKRTDIRLKWRKYELLTQDLTRKIPIRGLGKPLFTTHLTSLCILDRKNLFSWSSSNTQVESSSLSLTRHSRVFTRNKLIMSLFNSLYKIQHIHVNQETMPVTNDETLYPKDSITRKPRLKFKETAPKNLIWIKEVNGNISSRTNRE